MKKYILIFLLFCILAVLYLSFPINSKEHFVSIEKNKFILNGKDFYPVAVNYIISLQTDKKDLWICPYKGYNPGSGFTYTTKDSCLMQLKADMDLIKQIGFNAIRLGVQPIINKTTKELSIFVYTGNRGDTTIPLRDENYKKYFNALGEMFSIINNAGLKIIFLTKMDPEIKTTEEYLRRLAVRFKTDTSIMAYDLYNEPLYFDSLERNKADIRPITKRWNKIIKMYAPHQLSTIGLAGIREIFEWDPSILDVDFISFHPYNHEPEQVMNELYWYGKYVKKPWIIGETAVSADNDSITYEEQKKFAHKTLKQAYNCGASGYSWWQYKDVEWHAYLANYMGIVTRKGKTNTLKQNLSVAGTVKPVAEEFKSFKPSAKKDSCICMSNYYNWSQHKSFRIIGHLYDEKNNPIQGAVVLAWNQYWSHSYHTITKMDGSFELMSDFPFYHWIASATMYTMIRAEISPVTAKTYKDSIPTINIGDIKLSKLTFED